MVRLNFEGARRRLVEALKVEGIIRSPSVEHAMLKIPRELFVWPGYEEDSYVDIPLPLGSTGQTISAPHMVAIMLEELMLRHCLHVLEIGTGSGYNAALLFELVRPCGKVVTVERVPELAEFARRNLAAAGYGEPQVEVVVGDGTLGYPPRLEEELYDRIIVTAAAPKPPRSLLVQLKRNGMMLIPVGSPGYQELMRVVKDEEARMSEESLGGCIFVPLIGEEGYRG